MEVENDLSQSALLLTVPQAYLEYTSSDWDPPSRWDDGISGLIADYSLNAQTRHQEQGARTHMISAVTVQLGQTLGHGVSVQTGKVIISTPAATTMKMTAVTVQRVKLGLEPLLRLASFTLFKSEAVAGRRLSQFRYFRRL